MTPLKLIAWMLIAFLLSSPVFAEGWRAGAAKADITPKQPVWMSGYAARTKSAEGVLNPLYAKALVLEGAAGQRAVLVTLDLCGIDRDLSLSIRDSLMKRHKLPVESIALACSHTHSGPVVGSNLRTMYFLNEEQGRGVDAYTQTLKQSIDDAVAAAIKAMQPAQVSYAIGKADFAVNRRNNPEAQVPALREKGELKGPVDHEVPTLAVRDGEGKLIAIAFGYACHATTLDGYQWSSDFPGFAMEHIEASQPGAVALFFAGCGADQNPIPRRQVELAKQYGKRLGEAVDAVIAGKMAALKPLLLARYEEIPLALATLPTRAELETQTKSLNKYAAARAKMLLMRIEAGQPLSQTYPYPVQHWQLGGELKWVMLGGEVVVDYSLRIKRELGPGKTFVAGYVNDVMAYIPSKRVLLEGGYEGGGAMIYYGLPTVWDEKVEETVMEAVNRQVGK